MKTFGEYVRSKRKHKGFTLRDLAKATGLSQGYLSDIETGKRPNPSIKTFILLCDELNIMKFTAIGLF